MTKITLNIPDSDLTFFLKLIEKFNYDTIVDEVSITDEMKTILDERRKSSSKENFIPWEIAKKRLEFGNKNEL